MTVVDFAGRTVTLSQPAQRIIALAPHIVENLYSAGAGDRLVGVDLQGADRVPDRAAQHHERLGIERLFAPGLPDQEVEDDLLEDFDQHAPHLAGGHVRSDSLGQGRRHLAGLPHGLGDVLEVLLVPVGGGAADVEADLLVEEGDELVDAALGLGQIGVDARAGLSRQQLDLGARRHGAQDRGLGRLTPGSTMRPWAQSRPRSVS